MSARIEQWQEQVAVEVWTAAKALKRVFKLIWCAGHVRLDGLHNIESATYFLQPIYVCPLCDAGLPVPFPEVETEKELVAWLRRHLSSCAETTQDDDVTDQEQDAPAFVAEQTQDDDVTGQDKDGPTQDKATDQEQDAPACLAEAMSGVPSSRFLVGAEVRLTAEGKAQVDFVARHNARKMTPSNLDYARWCAVPDVEAGEAGSVIRFMLSGVTGQRGRRSLWAVRFPRATILCSAEMIEPAPRLASEPVPCQTSDPDRCAAMYDKPVPVRDAAGRRLGTCAVSRARHSDCGQFSWRPL
jgi:hypothetical protein